MNDKKYDFIVGELSTLARKEIDRDGAKIVCPFHNDTNPSGNVCLDIEETRAPLGWFRCWSCKTSVPWSELADKLGLRKYTNNKKSDKDYVDPSRYRKGLLTEQGDADSDEGFERDYKDLQFFDFQMEEWRGIPTASLEKLGCKFCYKDYTDSFYIWMPVYINKVLRGYVKAELEKPDPILKTDRNGKQWEMIPPSYVNAPGKWSSTYGLLFYDYAVKMMKRKDLKTIVLCEGPRDVIRLLRFGIPAMAVLGAANWNEKKRFQLEKTGAENVILFMDGDKAGKDATKMIYKDIKQHFNTKYMSLWKYAKPMLDKKGRKVRDEKGKVKMKGYDPFSCPKHFLETVKSNLK